jgi:hypothetical protein
MGTQERDQAPPTRRQRHEQHPTGLLTNFLCAACRVGRHSGLHVDSAIRAAAADRALQSRQALRRWSRDLGRIRECALKALAPADAAADGLVMVYRVQSLRFREGGGGDAGGFQCSLGRC